MSPHMDGEEGAIGASVVGEQPARPPDSRPSLCVLCELSVLCANSANVVKHTKLRTTCGPGRGLRPGDLSWSLAVVGDSAQRTLSSQRTQREWRSRWVREGISHAALGRFMRGGAPEYRIGRGDAARGDVMGGYRRRRNLTGWAMNLLNCPQSVRIGAPGRNS